MKSLNLYFLSRIHDRETFAIFEKHLSGRIKILKVKEEERLSLSVLVNTLLADDPSIDNLDGFYYSFEIPQIGKEFDLLRIGKSQTINIELKSRQVPEENILSQLIKNKYYLSHTNCNILLYSFIKSNKKLYRLDENNELIEDKISNLNEQLHNQTIRVIDDINSLFRVSDFLISPLNTPDKFIEKKYFLTAQQENFKRQFLEENKNNKQLYRFVGITGSPGTGKTLLLYDFANQCATKGKCCVIHCGMLSNGHNYLNQKIDSVNIMGAKKVTEDFNFSKYQYIFVDESHRIYKKQFEIIKNATIENGIITTFSFDSKQALSKAEIRADIGSSIRELPNYTEYKLSDKVRTNKELASFIRRLMNLNSNDIQPGYPSVLTSFANEESEAKKILRNFKENGYTFINYTESHYYGSSFDNYDYKYNTHEVIGQEFDKVVMLMDDTFSYDQQGKLQGSRHPNPDYIYLQLLFQGLTRVREKLAIIVVKDQALFTKILSIVQAV